MTLVLLPALNMGITFDIFRQEGNTPSVRQVLRNSASTGAMTTAADLKYFTSTLSETQLLLGLSRLISRLISTINFH